MEYWPRVAGNSKLHVHMVDVNTKEMVGAWLATVTALPPVVTKTYDIDIPIGDDGANKRIAYTNTWGRGRVFRLRSSNPDVTEVVLPLFLSPFVFSIQQQLLIIILN